MKKFLFYFIAVSIVATLWGCGAKDDFGKAFANSFSDSLVDSLSKSLGGQSFDKSFKAGDWVHEITPGHEETVHYDDVKKEIRFTYACAVSICHMDIEAGLYLEDVAFEDKGDYKVFYGKVHFFNEKEIQEVKSMSIPHIIKYPDKPVTDATKNYGAVYVKKTGDKTAEIAFYIPGVQSGVGLLTSVATPPVATAALDDLKKLGETDLREAKAGGFSVKAMGGEFTLQ